MALEHLIHYQHSRSYPKPQLQLSNHISLQNFNYYSNNAPTSPHRNNNTTRSPSSVNQKFSHQLIKVSAPSIAKLQAEGGTSSRSFLRTTSPRFAESCTLQTGYRPLLLRKILDGTMQRIVIFGAGC